MQQKNLEYLWTDGMEDNTTLDSPFIWGGGMINK